MDKTERRQDILRAARRLFATKGYHDAKIDDIVAAARVAKGTFYLYFRDKRSIFVELVDTLFKQIDSAILRVDPEGDVAAQIKHNIRAVLAVLLDDPETTQILMSHAAGLDEEFTAKIQLFYDKVKALLCKSLSDGQRLGIVAEGDPSLMATFSIGAIKEVLLEMMTSRKPPSREKVVDELFRLFECGYLRIGSAETKETNKASRPANARRSAHRRTKDNSTIAHDTPIPSRTNNS